MGYDNECVVNILSLPGEYFCPVCRTLIYPNEALQSQCTHLYCKPCLAYVVATTHACPYDGYLVTEADSKPLVESSKELAETIGKTAVHCLYHRSGCQWQGTLAESTVHCAGCNYGNSAVVCNRCGTQIIHRQVQEHAQICPGIQPQAPVAENAQAQAAVAANQAASQDPSSAASAAATAAAATTATPAATPAAATTVAPSAPASAPSAASAATGQTQAQGGAVVYPQAAAQVPTPEQWYQQQQMQYQQYYQQYPGYDPYQQQYQQYAQYQQQAYPQYIQPQMQAASQHVIPGQQQPQPYMQQPLPQPQPGQPQPQAQPQTQPQGPGAQPQLQQQHLAQPQPQPQPQLHPLPQPQAQPQPHVPAQVPQVQMQQPPVPPQQPHAHAQPNTLPTPHGHAAGQPYAQPQPHAAQARPPQLQAPHQHQQPIPPQQLPQQMPHPQAYPQPQPRPQHPPQNQPLPHPQPQLQQAPMQMQPQPQPHHHSQPIPQMQPPQPPAHAVSGYQSYPQPIPVPPQQRPMHVHPQQQGMPPQHPPQSQSQFLPQQPPQMRPPNSQMPMSVQQQPAMPPPQGPHSNLHHPPQQVQHPVHQPGQQVFQQSGMQAHGNHGFPQPQAQGTLHPGISLQQGPVPPQHQLYPQQSLRPQGPAYMQQPAPGQPHPQLNAAPAQGLPQHQAQARPTMVGQGMLQQPVPQSPGAGSKLVKPCVNQQSPNQNYMGRANPPALMSSELQSQLPCSGGQGGLVPASPATPKQGTSTLDKICQVPPTEDGKTIKNAEGTETGEKISEDMFDSKSKGDEGKDVAELNEKDGQAENNSKDVLETLEKEKNVEGQMAKQVKVEEGANRSGEVTESSHGLKLAGGEKEIQGQEGKRDAGSDKSTQQESFRPNLEKTNQGYVSDGQIGGTVVSNMHPQQMQAPGALDRGQLQQQSTHQNVTPAQGRIYPQPAYNDRNPPQFPQQYPGSDDRQMPPGVPQQIPYGHPHMSEPPMMSQRPPAPDRMFPQPMHQSSQERRFPEPSSYQMHVHGQAMPPSQMRPPGHNVHETFPHQGQMPGQEPFWPPPHAGISGPGPVPPSGGVLSHHGFPTKGFDQQAMAPQGKAQSHLPPPHVGGARTALGDHLARPFMGGPPPGPLDTPSRMMGGPHFIPEDKVGKPATVNAMEAEAHKRPGVYDGRQLEPHRHLPTEHAPYREPSVMKMNGMSNIVPVGGMHDTAFARLPEDRFRPLPEERIKPFPEEGFKAAHDERFRPSALDPGRHIVNRREFEEDLKQFPRQAHLDGEGPPRLDGYMSSSRPLDRMAQQPGGPNAMTSRPMSSYQSGAAFPPGIGGSEVHMDIGDRDRPIALHEHLGRRHDGTFPHPDRLNLVPEFGRHRADGLPPLRSPGRFSRDIPDGLPSQLRRGMDGLGPLGPGLSNNIRGGEIVGSQNVPNFLRGGGFGGFRNHLDIGEPGGPGNLPSHLRIGDPGFNGRFSSVSRDGDIGSFEQSRKRKAGSMVRCLICKIDCETVEGLELHSQGREHQKMAMDMVLSIKKENAKKHRTSENSTPFEGANKSRKANFEKRANRQ